MFEYLKKHDQIVVTGPHRAGTTIATTMIADELGYKCVLEEEVTLFCTFKSKLNNNHINGIKAVYQVPLLASQCHMLDDYAAVVFMDRSVTDILASEKRINWGSPGVGNEPREMVKYFRDIENPDKEWETMPIATVKYIVWNEIQKKNIKFPYELEYNTLAEHKLWVPKEERKDFKPRQTEI